MRSRWLWVLLIGVGIAVVIAGLGYDLLWAGIPYQDPPPELAARYNFHARVAAAVRQVGVGLGCGGGIGIMVSWVIRKQRQGES